MSWTNKIKTWINNRQKEIQRGAEITEQRRAEKLRMKRNKLAKAKPSTSTTIRRGLATRAKPWEVAKEEYDRRKYERKKKKR